MVKKPFKYTHVGRLPEDWDCLQAIEVIDEISMGPFGSDITVSNFVSSGVPVLNGYNVSQIMLIDKFQNFVTPKKAKELKKAVAHRGDIIVTHRGTIGQVSYIPDSSAYSEYVISQSQFRVHFNDKRVNSHFLVSYLLSPIGQKYLLETKGHTGVPALAQPTTNFRRLWIPLPEIAEQVAIAEALSDADNLIFSLQKLIEKKKAIKQGAMQELLTGKKRLPGFSGKWTNTTLGKCFSKIVGGGTPSRAISEFWNGEIPWATVKDFATFNPYKTQEYISEAGLNHSSTHLIPKGTLITSTRMGIGKIVIYYVDVAINQDLKALFISDDVSKEYIYHLFGMVGKIIESLGNGSTVKGIRIEQLKNLSIVLPKKNEQQAIAQVLSDMDSEIEQLEKKLAKYQQIKQGMMQELLTGRIRLVNTDRGNTSEV